MSTNQQLQQRREQAMARGMPSQLAVYVDRAANAELWDVEGRRYIDFGTGIAVLNTGHLHPGVQAAVSRQLDRFSHTCFMVTPYESAVALAEKLNALAPGKTPKKTLFVTTGAEAVENAVKIARVHTGRTGVISFGGSFHGRTLLAMGLTGKTAPYKAGFGPFPAEIHHAPFPIAYHGDQRRPTRWPASSGSSPRTSSRRGSRRSSWSRCRGRAASTSRRPNSCKALRAALRPARHRADRRRDPDRLRPHGEDVRDGALRRRARPDDRGQEPGGRLPAGGCHRQGSHHGRAGAGRPRRHLRGIAHRLRGRASPCSRRWRRSSCRRARTRSATSSPRGSASWPGSTTASATCAGSARWWRWNS